MNAHELVEAYVDDVVRHLDRRRRKDVGMELRALLRDELQAQITAARREADVPMVTDLLRRFGRPEDVAARYRQPGFPIVDAADAPAFVRLSAIGMTTVWVIGLIATFRSGGGLEKLGAWWMTFGLGAFWWPGFLVVCVGVAAWMRRRFPHADDWMPRVVDRDRINRFGRVLATACFTLGTIWLTSPAQFVQQVSGGRLSPEFYGQLVYDDTFRRWRLPLLLLLMTGHLVLYGVLAAQGRWQPLTRRLDTILSAAVTGLLVWSVVAGRIFQGEISNSVTQNTIGLIALFVIWDIGTKLYRELVRVRQPSLAS